MGFHLVVAEITSEACFFFINFYSDLFGRNDF